MKIALLLVALCAFAMQAKSDTLDKLADDFWTWRARYAPFTGDDVNRMERPGGMRDGSRASIDKRRKDLTEFETRWKKIDIGGVPVSQTNDQKLVGLAVLAGLLGAADHIAL